ncbi:MAG TPA: O-antigen ligase family protein, partial [Chloroflexota bacterium]
LNPPATGRGLAGAGRLSLALSRALFGLFVLVVLSLRSIWLRDSVPVWSFPEPFPTLHAQLGAFVVPIVLAGLTGIPWIIGRLLEQPRRGWTWGRLSIFLPLLALSALVVAGLDPARSARTSSEIPKLLAFVWFAYLFLVNERPSISVPIALAALVQGGVATLQFLTQGDLGLRSIGELELNPNVDGISIMWVQERAWIRAYGLTDHPNWLGATMAVCVLWLLAALPASRGARRWVLLAGVAAGFLGMMASFSRAAWIGFGAGLLLFLFLEARKRRSMPLVLRPQVLVALLLALAVLFLLPFREQLLSRMVPGDNPVEVRSIVERVRDARVALEVIEAHPWRGVGAGGFLDAAWPLEPRALTVHDVPLLLTAEFGLPALALWLALILATFLSPAPATGGDPSESDARAAPACRLPAWTASLVIGLLDPNPWPLLMLSSAILFGLLLGSLASPRAKIVAAVPPVPAS